MLSVSFLAAMGSNAGAVPLSQENQTLSTAVVKVDPEHKRRLNQFSCFNTDVRVALEQLFRAENVRYELSPDVQGTVTLELRQIEWKIALENVVREVDARFRIRHGVYFVAHLKQPVIPVPKGHPTPVSNLFFSFHQTDIRDALHQLLAPFGITYRIAPEVHGTISGEYLNMTFEKTLQLLTQQSNLTYRIVGGIYEFQQRP
jgi:type II secretory pathway component GspD/PulD (secretin)